MPTQASTAPATVTTTSQNHPVYASFLAQSFLTDPVFTYLLDAPEWHARPTPTFQIFRATLAAAAYKKRGVFYSASTAPDAELHPQCAAVVMPPGQDAFRVPVWTWARSFWGGAWRLLPFVRGMHTKFASEYLGPVAKAKASVFAPGETYYYVMYIATGAEYRGKGLAQALLGELQARGQEEMKPIWLEASSPASRRVYAKCGFEDVGEVLRMGKGVVGEDGEPWKGEGEGKGVPVFPMVWWPVGYKKN